MGAVHPKTSQIIKYLVSRLAGRLGKTKLIKLVYLADLEARRVMGRPISDLKYRWYTHGPWDERFYEHLKILQKAGAIEAETYHYRDGTGTLFHNGKEIQCSLSDGERAILDYLIREYGHLNRQELVEEVVYETKPMKDAQKRKAFHQLLRMDLVDNELRHELEGLDFEAMAKAAHELEEGQGIPLSEVLSGLERQDRAIGNR